MLLTNTLIIDSLLATCYCTCEGQNTKTFKINNSSLIIFNIYI